MIQHPIDNLKSKYNVNAIIDFDDISSDVYEFESKVRKLLCTLYKEKYDADEKIVFYYTSDWYDDDNITGIKLKVLQKLLNEIDISNFFACVVTTNPDCDKEYREIHKSNFDSVPINIFSVDGDFEQIKIKKVKDYTYGNPIPWKITLDELSDKEKNWLITSDRFCMLPWVHIHANPNGKIQPCCLTNASSEELANAHQSTLKQAWNSDRMKELRCDMLNERKNDYCTNCYEQEESGFFSGRQSANKHHGHLVKRVNETHSDGTFDRFEMTYWDIRFSNLCNLRCRSCEHSLSSSWYKDQSKLAGPEWAKNNKPLLIAGKDPDDMWAQLKEHLDYVEQIYFAGGEPLMMHEHYNILEELVARKRFDVRLIYNTNFTHVKLKNKSVFEYWKLFDSVVVGASLDASGPHGEYIRKGTDWAEVEKNRKEMLAVCPDVDFYISPTLSIMNSLHIVDFHRDWVEKGFLKPQDLNVNILQNPNYYSIQIAPSEMKQKIAEKYTEHLEWLKPQDKLQRARIGFESALNYLHAEDNSHLIPEFWKKTRQLDDIRGENILDVIPELEDMK